MPPYLANHRTLKSRADGIGVAAKGGSAVEFGVDGEEVGYYTLRGF